MKVLIVDDEADIVDSIRTLLELMAPEIEVLSASSGKAGLELLSGVDVVLSDFRMPGMDGLEFLHTVAERQPESRRLLMTAHPDKALQAQAADAGIDGFVPKPMDVDSLLETLRSLA